MEDIDFVGVSLSKLLFLLVFVDLKSRWHTSTDTLPQYFSKVGNRRVSTFGPMVQQGHNTGTGGSSFILTGLPHLCQHHSCGETATAMLCVGDSSARRLAQMRVVLCSLLSLSG